jgi:hypothetical protein
VGHSIVLMAVADTGLGDVIDVQFQIGWVHDSAMEVVDVSASLNTLSATLGIARQCGRRATHAGFGNQLICAIAPVLVAPAHPPRGR